jgi:Ca2+-binding EF-hand superfamily protein
MSTSPTSLSSP